MGHAQTVYNFPTLDATMKLEVDEIEHYDGEYEADTTSLEWDSDNLVAVGSSGILKAKHKLGVTFNFNKQDIIDLKKFSKMTMCRASEANSYK